MLNLLALETTSRSSGVRRQGGDNVVVYTEYRLGQQVYALASPTIQSSGPAQKLQEVFRTQERTKTSQGLGGISK